MSAEPADCLYTESGQRVLAVSLAECERRVEEAKRFWGEQTRKGHEEIVRDLEAEVERLKGRAAERPGRQHPGVGVGVLVLDRTRNNLLMVRRAGSHGAGTWTVPGGWVEQGEDPLETAVREVREETGCEIVLRSAPRLGWSSVVHHEDETIHAITLWIASDVDAKGPEPSIVEPDKCPIVEWVRWGDVELRELFNPMAEAWCYLRHLQPVR